MEKPKLDDAGQMVMVVRPTHKSKAIRMAMKGVKNNKMPPFNEMQDKCGPYTFIGYLSIKGEIIFDNGGGFKKVGLCKKGDSFISPIKSERDKNTHENI
jgi:hypothetical protein